MALRLLSILSRNFDNEPNVGRKATLVRWLSYMNRKFDHRIFVPAMAQNFGIVPLIYALMRHSVFGRFPLQAALYNTGNNLKRIQDEILEFRPEILFIEGGRLVPLIMRALRSEKIKRDDFKIIVDADDLLSRRYHLYKKLGLGLDVGVLGAKLNRYVKYVGPSMSDRILDFEAGRMLKVEKQILNFADDVIMSNGFEARLLARQVKTFKACMHTQMIGYDIDPVVPNLLPDRLCFGFIGGDTLSQNYLSIKALIHFWRRYQI